MKPDNEIYTDEEMEVIDAVEKGDYIALSQNEFEKEKHRFQMMAINTMKTRTIPIDIIEQDIPKIKAIALNEGVPYQIFIASILHKVAIGKLKI
jgi:predicted DNA binding CopG/RHH family protein